MAAAIVFRVGGIVLLFVLLFSRSVESQSRETLGELLHCPPFHYLNTVSSSLKKVIQSCFWPAAAKKTDEEQGSPVG